jgi:deoxycytidylate deaminase
MISHEFKSLFAAMHLSGCAKRSVTAGIYVQEDPNRLPSFEIAANACSWAEGVTACPRIGIASGTGYDLCTAQHAEANLVRNLKQRGLKPAVPIAWVAGHYYACEPCAKALKEFGITEIRVREFSALTEIDRPEHPMGPGC